MSRILALDVGERRIGIASGDTVTGLAVPDGVIERRGTDADWAAVLKEATSRDADLILVGMPLSLSGLVGPQAAITETFVSELRRRTTIPVETWDERFSTSEAEHRLRQGRGQTRRGKPPRAPREAVDAAAATVILQSYLDAQ